jgi:hypothetical protein
LSEGAWSLAQLWVPNWENRDLRELLWHRMVQMRTRVMNQLQAAAAEGDLPLPLNSMLS